MFCNYDPAHALRAAMDEGLAIPSIMGVSEYQSYLIIITNDQINSDDSSNNKVVVTSRLTVADGYRCWAPRDGYLNPMLKQMAGEQITISNGQLTNNLLVLGPLVFPYEICCETRGTDPQRFQTVSYQSNNTQIYIQIKGLGLSPLGNFFQVKEIKIDDMGSLSYHVLLEATVTVPNLS